MTIRRKLLLISIASSAMVGGVGAIGLSALLETAEYLRLGPPTPALLNVNRAIDWLIWLIPLGTAMAVALGAAVANTISQRLNQLRTPPKPGAFPLSSLRDEVDDIAFMINDMSARNRALTEKAISEQQLLAARRFADNIIKSMYDILIVTDPELNIVTVNKAACDLLEYTEIELVGKPIDRLFRAESVLQGPPIRAMLLDHAARDLEMTYRTRSGRYVFALVSASTMRDEAGRPLAIITVGKDITSRKQIEHDLYEAKVAAEAASRAKSAFVANMSHEIRTPMTAILGYADLLGQADQSPTQRDNCVTTIRRNGQHLLGIINDILDVSKIEAGKMTLERIACSPVQLICDVAALMRGRAADKNLAFDVRFIGQIPQTIQSDPTRLRQILVNLTGNAVKFTSQGGIKLIVSMQQSNGDQPSRLRFDVVDTGLGLTPKQQESLFRPFVQADESTTRKFGGTGLGLTISKRLAEMLGGEISLRSVAGNGSTFSLMIDTGDLTGVAMIDPPSVDPQKLPDPPTFWLGKQRLSGRVLVAEDGPDNRVLVSFYLEHAGLNVTLVENGKLACDAALQAASEDRPFDLILMDMQMPEMDGYAATTLLRELKYTRPIVALTAHAMGGDREKCIACGCDDFAVKPIDPDRFMATVKKYVQLATQDPETADGLADASIKMAITGGDDPMSTLLAKPKLAKLVDRFVTGLDDRMTAIQQAAEEDDHKQLKMLAHQLKGAAGGFGFPAVSRAAADVEHATETDLTALTQSVAELADLCHQAKSHHTPR